MPPETQTREFEQIVTEHQQMVFRTLARLLSSHDRLEDLAQDVFLRLYRSLPNFRGDALVSTYLYRITVNVANDELKRRKRIDKPLTSISEEENPWEDRLAHPSRNAEQQLIDREFRSAVRQQLQQLSPIERSILVLYHQEERSYQQIAAALGLPIGTVRTHLHRGRQKLRQGIQQQTVSRQRLTERQTA